MKIPNKFKKWWIKHRKLMHCPFCRSIITPKWVKDCVVFEDEPPMFCHYECSKCKARLTDILITQLTMNALKRLGYNSIQEYINASSR